MKIALRVDASDGIGAGHLSRCLALAEALRADGAQTLFLCRAHAGHGGARVEAEGHALRLLPAGESPARGPVDPAYLAWLGASWQEDAQQSTQAIAGVFGEAGADWLVVDHYALDARWEGAMRQCARKRLAIDDLADRVHDVEMLLDQNIVAGMHERYETRVGAGCLSLLGPQFALLQREFAQLHVQARPRSGAARRVLVFFGGGDAAGLTDRFLSALGEGPRDYELDVVLPYGHARPPERQRLRFHQNLHSLSHLLAQSDLALGAGGVSNWERLCLGVPALVVSVAENQRAICEELGRLGLIQYLGEEAALDGARLLAELDHAASQEHSAWSRRCLAAVDGLGAARVAALLTVGAATPLRARRARADDEALLLDWANEAEARAQAFTEGRITPEVHAHWFRKRLDSAACRILVVETGAGLPIGQVRFERGEGAGEWTISYSLDTSFRGRGLGTRVLSTGLDALAAEFPGTAVLGLVKPGNAASRRVFEALGFGLRERGDALEYRCELRA